MRIAVLGTGIMGAPMARNLADAGHEVRVYNRSAAKAEGLGAQVTGSPAEAAEGAEVVITMLADGDAVETVMDGVTLTGEQIWWQASTVGSAATERLAALAGAAAFVDGPVSGTKQPAERGERRPPPASTSPCRRSCATRCSARSPRGMVTRTWPLRSWPHV